MEYFIFIFIQRKPSQEGRDSCLKINNYYVEISDIEISSNSFSYDMPATQVWNPIKIIAVF